MPILLAGGGERVTLRQVARYADASTMGAHDWFGGPVTGDDTARTFGKLRDSCAELDRPYESVLRSHVAMPLVMAETEAALAEKRRALPQDVLAWCGDALFAGTPEQTITYYRGLAAAGFQYFVANILDQDLSTIDLMIEHLVPAFSASSSPPPSPFHAAS